MRTQMERVAAWLHPKPPALLSCDSPTRSGAGHSWAATSKTARQNKLLSYSLNGLRHLPARCPDLVPRLSAPVSSAPVTITWGALHIHGGEKSGFGKLNLTGRKAFPHRQAEGGERSRGATLQGFRPAEAGRRVGVGGGPALPGLSRMRATRGSGSGANSPRPARAGRRVEGAESRGAGQTPEREPWAEATAGGGREEEPPSLAPPKSTGINRHALCSPARPRWTRPPRRRDRAAAAQPGLPRSSRAGHGAGRGGRGGRPVPAGRGG
ncbi:PREDICTED: translation initiation factor IF-2-like, partial [Chinchilla lanigera]|uniref:translation initiation factor IF-2-like n=1 Tax=Chinchilla lanigera TaxID=34839 RepID=UPI000696CD9B